MSWDWIKKWLESPAVVVIGCLISGIIGAGVAYLSMVLYLNQFVDGRIAASPRWDAMQASVAAVIPKGGLVYFDHAEGCPTGWKDIGAHEAGNFAGRVLVATGSHEHRVQRTYRQTGGNETHQLQEEEMPPHKHGVVSSTEFLWLRSSALGRPGEPQVEQLALVREFDPKRDLAQCRNCGPDYRMTVLSTVSSGGHKSEVKSQAAPHNSMPPFVAIFLCRKE